MDLISLVIVLAVLGFVWYLVITFIPMPAPMKTLITVIIVIAICLYLLQAFVGPIQIPRLR